MIPRDTGPGRTPPAGQRDREGGITLVELMVVITILGLMAAAVGIAVIPRLRSSRKRIAKAEMSTIGDAIELFQVEVGRLPEDLSELKSPPEGFEPFLKKGDIEDPWNHPYEYEALDNGQYRILSYGSDAMEGGTGDAEDLHYPEEEEGEL